MSTLDRGLSLLTVCRCQVKSTFIDGFGTVLFADIVSFTTFSQTLTAPQLVIMLNAMFMKFDKLAEKNEVRTFLGGLHTAVLVLIVRYC